MEAIRVMRRWRLARREGFVLPVVVFCLVLMSAVAVAALLTAEDEANSSRALREGAAGFYAAEAGLHELYAYWVDSVGPYIDTLPPGGSVTLPWRDLDNGSRYQATVSRWDDGHQPIYQLEVDGRGPGPRGGRRLLSFSLTAIPGEPGRGYTIGECCRAAVTMRGTAAVEESAGVSGFDRNPNQWGDSCPTADRDKPGIMIDDVNELEFDEGGWADGVPPVVQETMTDADFEQFGDLTWEDLKGMADHAVGEPDDADFEIDEGDVYPRYNGDGSCDTSHPYNWGSPDPNDECFGYFPIILIQGGVKLFGLYGQAIFILDYDESRPYMEKGSELDLEQGVVFNGIILGKGCVEIEEDALFHGGLFVDGNYRNEPMCNSDNDFAMNDGPARIHWSQCAVDRAILGAGLDEYADVDIPGKPGPARLLGSRSFGEALR